jgi:3-methyladenine DNA glycosylase/8-oxoguanine DNA glycosylase
MEENRNNEEELKAMVMILKEIEEIWSDIKNIMKDYFDKAERVFKIYETINKISKFMTILTIINITIFILLISIIILTNFKK